MHDSPPVGSGISSWWQRISPSHRRSGALATERQDSPARRGRHRAGTRRLRGVVTAQVAVVVTAAALLTAAGTAGATTAGRVSPAAAPAAALAAVSTNCTPVPAPQAPQLIPAGVHYGVRLSANQVAAAQIIMAVAKAMNVKARGARIAMAVAMVESSLNPKAVAGSLVGLFQQPHAAAYSAYSRSDAVGATRMFYAQLTKKVPGYATDPRADWRMAVQVLGATGLGPLFQSWHGLAVNLGANYFAKVPAYQFDPPLVTPSGCPSGTGFDPGNIISDAVFYNTTAMTTAQVRSFINTENAACKGTWCLRNLRVTTTSQPADQFCKAYTGRANQDAASVITALAVACGINPQVMLVTLQKETGLLTRTGVTAASWAAAWGWHCPDTGPGGAPKCDPAYAGFFNQAYGMAKQFARYRVNPGNYNYQAGKTVTILWNVAESHCGGAPVHIQNMATASLYDYTPYQPNAASLAGYPGTGDRCSSYGNRNFFYLFTGYFGSTGGGTRVVVNGTKVTIPASPYIPANLTGMTITAPNAAVANGIAAGLATVGTPYVWGGGTYGGPADQGCARGGGASNSCQGIVGFDCSGLTAYVLRQAGFVIPAGSSAQRAGGTRVAWASGRPGDIIGYPGHVAIYLGTLGGTRYLLEAPYPGAVVHVRTVSMASADTVLHRYWR